MLDFLLLLIAGGSQLVLAYLGIRMSTRPVRDARKMELAFIVAGTIGFVALIWAIIRQLTKLPGPVIAGFDRPHSYCSFRK